MLLDPSSLEAAELCELRGKAEHIRIMQQLPRLVEEALADFEAQRKFAGEEEVRSA